MIYGYAERQDLTCGRRCISGFWTPQVKQRNRRQFHISDLSEYADPRNQRQFHTLDVGDHEIDDSVTLQTTETTKSTTVPHFRRPGRRNRRQFHTSDY